MYYMGVYLSTPLPPDMVIWHQFIESTSATKYICL